MSLVRTFTHLAGQPHAPEALNTLKRMADLVYPIMKRHGWMLPVLAEFFPENPRLLGLNIGAGAKILIRLRPARAPGTFYPIEQLIGTMLHELTHNVHGPHDEKFYSLLKKLEDEYDVLVLSGWRGTGFFAPGKRLGDQSIEWRGAGGVPDRFDNAGRRKALEAAEARQRVEAFGTGGRLGGSKTRQQSGKTRQELAAEAAERRRVDEQSCAATHPSAHREADRAAADSIADIIADADLAEALAFSSALAESTAHATATTSASHVASTSCPRPSIAETRPANDDVIEIDSNSDSEIELLNTLVDQPVIGERQCPSCTYLNPPGRIEQLCEICGAQLPTSASRPLSKVWNCTICTLENEPQAEACQTCGFSKNQKDWVPKRRGRGDLETQVNPEAERSAPRVWSCELCTYANAYASRTCSVCEAPCPLTVPRASGSGRSGRFLGTGEVRREKAIIATPPPWNCRQCGKRGIAHEFWMCGTCGWIKDNSGVPQN